MRMTASSLRPMRRASTSALPAAVSNRQRLPSFDERDRERPFLVANHERFAAVFVVGQPPPFGECRAEGLAVAARGHRVGRVDELLAVGAEDRGQLFHVRRLHDFRERAHRLLGRVEHALLWLRLGARACRHGASAAPTNAEAILCFCMTVDLSANQRRRPPPPPPPPAPAALSARAGCLRRRAARYPENASDLVPLRSRAAAVSVLRPRDS